MDGSGPRFALTNGECRPGDPGPWDDVLEGWLHRALEDGEIRVGHHAEDAYLYRWRDLLVAVEDEELVRRELGDLIVQEQASRQAPPDPRTKSCRVAQTPRDYGVVKLTLRVDARDARQRLGSITREDGSLVRTGLNQCFAPQQIRKLGPGDEPTPTNESLVSSKSGGEPAVGVAIVDSGLAAEAIGTHPSVLTGLVGDRNRNDDDPLVVPPDITQLVGGHGTFVAGILKLVAPQTEFDPESCVYPDTGFTDDYQIVADLAAFDFTKIQIVNLSLGGYTEFDAPPFGLATALASLPGHVAIVAAAGNCASDRPFYPAALKGVIAVAAVDEELQPAWFTNRGWWVDACTYGVGILSTFVNGNPTWPGAKLPQKFTGWARWSGTSFAAPRVAALIANGMASGATAPEAAATLLVKGTPIPGLGVFVG